MIIERTELLQVRNSNDIVRVRQLTREWSIAAGFSLVDQTKMVTAARLMGADCIISGIRPQIAQTIVHLGVDLGDVGTKATLADAFATALKRRGLTVARAGAPRP